MRFMHFDNQNHCFKKFHDFTIAFHFLSNSMTMPRLEKKNTFLYFSPGCGHPCMHTFLEAVI